MVVGTIAVFSPAKQKIQSFNAIPRHVYVLGKLVAMSPILSRLGDPELCEQAARCIRDVTRWWP